MAASASAASRLVGVATRAIAAAPVRTLSGRARVHSGRPKLMLFSARKYDRWAFDAQNKRLGEPVALHYDEDQLTAKSAARMLEDYPEASERPAAVCAFVNDILNKDTLSVLASGGIKRVAMRCAGYDKVDLAAARSLGMRVSRVPAYSPHAVAEHAVALMMALNRQVKKAIDRERDGNFELDGLLGFDVFGKTVGVIGTGRIGLCFMRIMTGFGAKILAYDQYQNPEALALGVTYVPDLKQLLADSDVVSLHCALTKDSYHMIGAEALASMKRGAMLINTSRGALLDTQAAITALKSGQLGYLGVDVIEHEEGMVFHDLSTYGGIDDDAIARLMAFPNVLITGHQAFFTREALTNIAETSLGNVQRMLANEPCPNALVQ